MVCHVPHSENKLGTSSPTVAPRPLPLSRGGIGIYTILFIKFAESLSERIVHIFRIRRCQMNFFQRNMRFYRQFRVPPVRTIHRFFRVFRVFRGLFFVGSQMENGTIVSGLIDKIYPQRNADRRRFFDPGLSLKNNSFP
jgi:hypothetical protein